ncbi:MULTISPECIES: HD domain-containing protein [Marinobacter]|jgi:predicted HD phosphohydrolase|uniref:Phn-HD: phosphonate degradation operons associated HDIG domain protein n=2 Tax=Marinobacter TaxID=2742 RepID=A0A1W6K6R2_9GAMM|nr:MULTISPECIES: HD domain-containing protein [Marinobacter]ARM83070.1 Phn-HD: phosphonate degradation operons associated HDIG domain protein [Marinobacter salarius]EDM48095.1 phosphohydrolase, HD domain protein family, putative [Marinobacter algicola DG893]KXJ47457.1 MAG: phosphohydrolase [Marinobacter sp. Hex_13]MBS8230367.1 HD domain-containing protein [Marinobacter salarius]MCC4283799.1 HD domain-containing protein [Marinobacter salarius]|tara:strand:- start:65 stop:658 length:594 start_codon:yes stop_codon:yes gene_type:complete
MNQPTKNQATFTHMKDGKAEDWQVIASSFGEFAKGLPDRILSHLKMLEGDFGGFPVDRLTHCLQTATLAHRDGKDDEYVVCALLHDIGDTLGTYNHADVAAVLLEPFVSDANHWMVKHHAIFQGYFFFHYLGMNRDMRDQYRDHPHFERTIEFVHKYDSPAFDPDAETLPLSYFEPMVQRVFAQPVRSLYKDAESVM